MNDRIVTVFGGTGFLGRRVVRHLRKRGFSVRIASRHPDRGHSLFALDDPQLQSVKANIHDERSVADALAGAYGMHAITFECGGPRIYSYEELLRAVAHEASLKPRLIPIPFAAWHALAWFAEMLPSPLVTRNQVELMQVDNVSSPEMPGFGELGISPHSVEEILQEILWDH